jgi:hypothetical protein
MPACLMPLLFVVQKNKNEEPGNIFITLHALIRDLKIKRLLPHNNKAALLYCPQKS